MAYGAMGPQPHQIGNQAYFKSGGGAKLIGRTFVYFTGSLTVPDSAMWLSARAIGPGGTANGNPYGGGGGAFARKDRACTPGQSITVNLDGVASVTLAGVLICSAAAGSAGAAGGGLGGQAAASIGDVTSSGGRGGGNVGQSGGAGTNGPSGQVSSTAGMVVGGSSAGERNALDAILLGGPGQVGRAQGSETGFPGGGGGYDVNQAGVGTGAPGVVCLEFWSAKP